MSIRRKTCETMTLLYEAALKTNPEFEEPKDRPVPVQPTAGVLPRETVGRVVWIPDDTRKGGGIFLAATNQDRQDSGVPEENCIVVDDLEPGSEYARLWDIAVGQGAREKDDTQQQVLNGATVALPTQQTMSEVARPGHMQPIAQEPIGVFTDVQSGTNVNPQMNFGDMFPNMTVIAPGSEISVRGHSAMGSFGARLIVPERRSSARRLDA